MKPPTSLARRAATPQMRAVRFEDVSEVLRLVGRAVAIGCREHYTPQERAAVHAAYAETLFVDVLGPFEAILAEVEGRIVGFAQLDSAGSRLRALFVDDGFQGQGVGRALLAEVEASAFRRGCARLHGAMSLNAVAFYAAAGYHPCAGPERLMSGMTPVPVVRMEKSLRPKARRRSAS